MGPGIQLPQLRVVDFAKSAFEEDNMISERDHDSPFLFTKALLDLVRFFS